MPWLTPDDDVRRLQAVWVTGPGPVQARFVAWGAAAGGTVAVYPFAAFVIPVAAIVGAGAWLVWSRRRDRTSGLAAGLVVALTLLVVPFSALFAPMGWTPALFVAPVGGVLVSRLTMLHVRYETPVRYWVASLRAEAASPRARPAVRYVVRGTR